MLQCRVGAWHVRRCLWISSWKWKHGKSRSDMPSFSCVKLCDIATTTHGKFQQAFGEDATSRACGFRWHKMFSEGRTLIEDDAAQRMTISNTDRWNIARVRELIRYDIRLTVRIIADEVNMNRETVCLIPTEELGMRKICAQMVPRNLTEQQRHARLSAVFDIQMHYGDAAASFVTWSRTFRLVFISKSKIDSERTPFWVNRKHPEVCNAGLKLHLTKCIPGMLQRMTAALEKVWAGTRDILWRWPHFSWWIDIIKLFFWNQSHYFTVGPHIGLYLRHINNKTI